MSSPLKAEEVRLLHALFLTKKRLKACFDLEGAEIEALQDAIDGVFEYFCEFMLQGLEVEEKPENAPTLHNPPKP